MILSCNSCEKKFVVPDQAITSDGRIVQCGSCGNKWKQFPLSQNKVLPIKKVKKLKTISETKIPKTNKKISRKNRQINLYSPEYLAKKHGINLNEIEDNSKTKKKVSFGFYCNFIIFFVLIIFFSRGLYFIQDIVIQRLPFTEFYLKYFLKVFGICLFGKSYFKLLDSRSLI